MAVVQQLRSPSAILVLNAGLQGIIRLISNVVLARLLFPEAFALTAVATVVMIGVQMLSDVGIATAALRDGVPNDQEVSRLWTIQLIRGIILAIILALCSLLVSFIYGSSTLGNVLLVLAIVPAIQGFQSLYPITRLAHQDLIPSVAIDLTARLLGALLSILFAYFYPSVWALVVGMVAQALISTGVSHALDRSGVSKFELDWQYLKKKWEFFRWIQLGSALTFVAMQADKALFPFFYGLAPLGVYAIAANFALMLTQITQRWSGTIFFPLVARLIGQGAAAREKLQKVRAAMLCYTAVAVALMILISPTFFVILYRPEYHSAGAIAQALAALVYFEMAESGLRHFPLVERTSRYEFLAVKVRIAAFGFFVTVVYALKAGPAYYALAFAAGQATSYFYMLFICWRSCYVGGRHDLLISGALIFWLTISFAYPVNLIDHAIFAVTALLLAGGAGLALYRLLGLPSVSQRELETYMQPDSAIP